MRNLAYLGGFMSKLFSTKLTNVFLVLLALLFVGIIALTAVEGVAMADSSQNMTNSDTLTIGHMSDIHNFPLKYCYQDVKNDNYKQSDFYHSMTGDTKLVLESGVILNQQIKKILQDGKNGTAPEYLVASGDLSKNGEHAALIDVANSLRYLQNEMRSLGGKYANFQVFAITGNHDLYNTAGAYYSQEDGDSRTADSVTTAEFALIFAGLGFPNANLTGENNAINLTEYLPEDYWYSSYTSGYQASQNASNLKITYYSPELNQVANETDSAKKLEHYYNISDDHNQLTFFAEIQGEHSGYSFAIIEANDREQVEIGSIVRIGLNEFNRNTSSRTYFLEDANGKIKKSKPLTDRAVIEDAFAQGKRVYRATGYDHFTGGRIKEECLNWLEERCNEQVGEKTTLGEETIIAVFHQNVLPHWDQEDEIQKDFTLYNWEYTAKRFLEMGIRYTLTGHMHASDIMSYTDIEGRTLYDFETGSCVSIPSPRRYLTLERNSCDGKLGEVMTSSIYTLDTLKELASDNIFACAPWDQSAYESAMATYNANPTQENWDNVVKSNPEYLTYIIQYEYLSKLSYDEYVNKDIYSILVERMVSHFINEGKINSLKKKLSNFLLDPANDKTVSMIARFLTGNKDSLNRLVTYIIDTALYRLYPDTNGDGNAEYPYDGNTYGSALDWLLAIIDDLLAMSFGDENLQSTVNPTNSGKMTLSQMASFIMASHGMGIEISLDETYTQIDEMFAEKACGDDHFAYQLPYDKTYRKRMLSAVKDLHAQLLSGKFAKDLFDAVLDPLFVSDNSLLKTLLNYSFDFRDAVDKEYLTQSEYDKLNRNLKNIKSLFPLVENLLKSMGMAVTFPEDFAIKSDDFVLSETLNPLMPLVKNLLAKFIGFNLDGDDIISAIQNVLDDYLTQSFYVGLGGIADGIVVAFATDQIPDYADNADTTKPFTVQPNENYTYAEKPVSYISTNNAVSTVGAEFNPATQLNGRVPSRVTNNFDTADEQGTYVVKFYTEEFVYGTFRLFDDEGRVVAEVSTNRNTALENFKSMDTDYLSTSASQTVNGISIEMITKTNPVYIPLIDLGLLCITHSEIEYEGDEDSAITYGYYDRDNAVENSVIFWNTTTVKISGLDPNTTYKYDVLGNYVAPGEDDLSYFSLAEFQKTLGYDKDYFTLTTAPDDSVTDFEFLTIADIQGMIQSMYDESHSAVDALLKDSRTNDFDFILNAGDMCDNGKNFNQWGYALNTYQDLFRNTSMFFTAGNHEGGTNAMSNYFAYTTPNEQTNVKDGMYYSFDYANAHFIVLNTNDADSEGLGEKQLAWLTNDLQTKTSKWTFVLMHKSLYSGGSHSRDAEVVAMRNQLVPLFAKHGVNMVFAGHDHTYATTYLVNADGKAIDKTDVHNVQYTGDGVLYITLGTLGTKFYEYGENPETTSKFNDDNSVLGTLSSQTFGKVVVSGDTLTYTGYVYDRESDSISEIGTSTLTSNKIVYKSTVIAVSVVVPVVVIGAVVATILILRKKKVKTNAQPTEQTEQGELTEQTEQVEQPEQGE